MEVEVGEVMEAEEGEVVLQTDPCLQEDLENGLGGGVVLEPSPHPPQNNLYTQLFKSVRFPLCPCRYKTLNMNDESHVFCMCAIDTFSRQFATNRLFVLQKKMMSHLVLLVPEP